MDSGNGTDAGFLYSLILNPARDWTVVWVFPVLADLIPVYVELFPSSEARREKSSVIAWESIRKSAVFQIRNHGKSKA
jgi:hypothetical protein